MQHNKLLPLLSVLILSALVFGTLSVTPLEPARVSAASCAESASNLLLNGTMAGGNAQALGVIAKKWKPFVVGATTPVFENALNEGYDPNGSQYIWRDLNKWDAGIYQTVATLTPGQNYHFWIVWGQALHDIAGNNARATMMNRQIGVDLSGGTNPTSPNIVWSVPYYGEGGFNRPEWHLNFLASGTTATFFLRAQNGHTDGRNKVFFDTACLYPTGSTPTSTPWSPTPTATQTAAPAPTQTPIPGTKIDDADARIKYNNGWTQGADVRALNGTYHYARGAKGAAVTASHTFTGTQVTVWYIGYKNRGKARVIIDGVRVGIIDQYTPGVTFNLSQSFYNLAPGTHQLKIKNAGAKNALATDSIITLDAIEVPNTLSNEIPSNYFKAAAQRVTRTPTPSPTPTDTRVTPRLRPFRIAAPIAPTPEDPSVIWDSRLPGLNVSLAPANVAPGTLYWKLIRADYHDPFQHGGDFGGDHNMYFVITDENGARVANQKVWQSWPDDKTYALTNANGIGDIAMWANYWPENGPGPYNGYVAGLPSDEVRGMGLPGNNHVSFVLYFQKALKGGSADPTQTPTITPTNIPPSTTPTFTPTNLPPSSTPTDVPPSAEPTNTKTPTNVPPTVASSPTPAPSSATLDDTNSRVSYSANWTAGSDARAFNGTYHYARGAKGAPAKLAFTFQGTQIRITYIGYRNRGKAIIRIDGVKVGVIDQYTPGLIFNLSQTFGGLSPGTHTLKILNKGNKNVSAIDSIIVLDALEVFP